MHGKSEFSKIQGSVCNILLDATNICNILPKLNVSNELIVVKLKRNLKYRVHVYSELILPHIVHQELTYLKSCNKFYENISITKCLSSVDIIKFSCFVEIREQFDSVAEKPISDGKEMTEYKIDTSKIEFD